MKGMKQIIRAGVFAFAAVLPLIATSDDTDIYINNATPDPNSVPMLMFYLDYRPNVLASTLCANATTSCPQASFFGNATLSTGAANPYYLPADIAAIGSGKFLFYDLLRLALKAVMRLPEFDQKIKVGFMMSHNQVNNKSDGGAILQGFRLIDAAAAPDGVAGISAILDKLKSLAPLPNDQDHPNQATEAFFEFYRYLRGGAVSKGHMGIQDFEKQGNATPENMDVYAPASWDTNIETAASGTPTYISPLTGTSCSKVFTASFVFGDATADTDSNSLINALRSAGGMSKTGETIVTNSNPWNAVVGYLQGNDIGSSAYLGSDINGNQNVTSYFFYKGQQQNKMNALAAAGGTQPAVDLSSDDPGVIVAALVQTLREVLSVSTTFVAASIPVNVFNRAQAVNNVYIAIFEADANSKPTWSGNIKKLKIGTVAGVPTLVDATGADAVGNDGRIKASSRTFWTDASNAANLPADPKVPPDNDAGVDGKNVIMGGSGQKIPGFLANNTGLANSATTRKVYYWNETVPSAGGSVALTALNVDNTTRDALIPKLKPGLTAAAATGAQQTEVTNLLRYIRGLNDATDTVRTVLDPIPSGTRSIPWITGDPLHSRPRPINYGKFAGHTDPNNPAIYIAVGGNDGFMRLIRNTNSGGTELGEELWAFMPPEAMSTTRTGVEESQSILKNNGFLADPRSATRPYHPIGVDGPPVELVIDANGNGTVESGDKVFLYFGLRRGGKAIYALDITDPTAPAFKWRAAPAGAGSAFEEMGYAFGTPKLGRVSVGGVSTRALFFSGGYDEAKDALTYPTAADATGRAIYVVNADTGALIWKAVGGATYGVTSVSGGGTRFTHPGLVDSIPSGLTIVDTDGDALIDRIVVGDSGGNLWRADLVGGNRDDWKLSLLAKLGRHGESGATNDRRFFHEPDLVQTKSADGTPYDAVLIGSGDRENPLDKPDDSTFIANRFYMLRDTKVGVGAAVDSYASGTVTDLADTTSGSPFADVTQFNCDVATTQAACIAAKSGTGWKINMVTDDGEKVLASPLTIAGTVFFTSYVPTHDPTSCAPSEGEGYVYSVGISNGSTKLPPVDLDGDGVKDEQTPPADREMPAGEKLDSPGIPAEVVYVPGYGVLCPDLSFCSESSLPRIRSHWLRVKD